MKNIHRINGNIYITNDEEIKDGNWFLHPFNTIHKAGGNLIDKDFKKIILTDNPDLIKDGVQTIDDEFLEWFVKNPSCEVVEVERKTIIEYEPIGHAGGVYKYKTIIPKEEPKQETLEEASSKYGIGTYPSIKFEDYTPQMKLMYAQITTAFENGAKWQQQQNKNLYSEEQVRKICLDFFYYWWNSKGTNTEEGFNEWFEQFKKK